MTLHSPFIPKTPADLTPGVRFVVPAVNGWPSTLVEVTENPATDNPVGWPEPALKAKAVAGETFHYIPHGYLQAFIDLGHEFTKAPTVAYGVDPKLMAEVARLAAKVGELTEAYERDKEQISKESYEEGVRYALATAPLLWLQIGDSGVFCPVWAQVAPDQLKKIRETLLRVRMPEIRKGAVIAGPDGKPAGIAQHDVYGAAIYDTMLVGPEHKEPDFGWTIGQAMGGSPLDRLFPPGSVYAEGVRTDVPRCSLKPIEREETPGAAVEPAAMLREHAMEGPEIRKPIAELWEGVDVRNGLKLVARPSGPHRGEWSVVEPFENSNAYLVNELGGAQGNEVYTEEQIKTLFVPITERVEGMLEATETGRHALAGEPASEPPKEEATPITTEIPAGALRAGFTVVCRGVDGDGLRWNIEKVEDALPLSLGCRNTITGEFRYFAPEDFKDALRVEVTPPSDPAETTDLSWIRPGASYTDEVGGEWRVLQYAHGTGVVRDVTQRYVTVRNYVTHEQKELSARDLGKVHVGRRSAQ